MAKGPAEAAEGSEEDAAAATEALRRLGHLERLARALAPPRPAQGPATPEGLAKVVQEDEEATEEAAGAAAAAAAVSFHLPSRVGLKTHWGATSCAGCYEHAL